MARGLSESSGNLILPNNSVLQLSTFRRQCRVSASSIVLHCSHIGGDAVEVHVGGETRHDLETGVFWRPRNENNKQMECGELTLLGLHYCTISGSNKQKLTLFDDFMAMPWHRHGPSWLCLGPLSQCHGSSEGLPWHHRLPWHCPGGAAMAVP